MGRTHNNYIVPIENYVVKCLKDVTYPCQLCKEPAILSSRCILHKKKSKIKGKAEQNEVLVCWYCEQYFLTKNVLSAHIKVEHGRLMFSNPELIWYACNICCNKLYMRSQDIVKHMRNVHGKVSTQALDYVVHSLQDITSVCKNCDKECILSKTCAKHKEKPSSSVLCKEYDEQSVSGVSSECREHERSIEKCHTCQRCDFKSDECNQLWSHIFSEHKSKSDTLICNLCVGLSVHIKNTTFLTRHMKKRHKKKLKLEITPRNDELKEKCKMMVDGSEMYKCPDCGTLVKNIWSLREHMMIHTGERPHICKVCSKSFRNRGKLNVHYKRVHEQIRTHQCNHCGRAFSDKSNLTVHIRTHTDEKKYMCELCGAEFAQWATLYNHKFTHNNVKFKCTYCEKFYNNPSNLQRHIKTHTDSSLYICEICGKDFGTARYLKRHKDTHNTPHVFICEVCNTGFKVKKHLTHHYKSHSIFIPPDQYPLINPTPCDTTTLFKL